MSPFPDRWYPPDDRQQPHAHRAGAAARLAPGRPAPARRTRRQRAACRPAGDGPPARGLRHPAPDDPRCSAAGRGRRLHRRRQVDPGELHRGPQGDPAGRAPADHPFAGPGAQPRRRRVVRAGPAAARPRAGRLLHQRPPLAPAGAGRHHARRAGRPRRTRRRLGRGAEPHPRGAAARRGRPVAVRHLGRAVRRPGAVGLPAPGRGAQRLGRDRARPHAGRGHRDGLHPPGPDARRAAASRTRRCSSSPRPRSTTMACCPPRRSPRCVAGWTHSPTTPTPGPWWSGRRSRVPSAP